MSKREKKRIEKIPARVVLSDVLPYETPIIFSNRYFYRFIESNNIEYSEAALRWTRNVKGLDRILSFIFTRKLEYRNCSSRASKSSKCFVQESHKIVKGNKTLQYKVLLDSESPVWKTVPYKYNIDHRSLGQRLLSVIHPRNQLMIIGFYEKYYSEILRNCSVSRYSIRRPNRVAKYYYHKDRSHFLNKAPEMRGIEQSDKEYEYLVSYFTYKRYSRLYKFFQSKTFFRAEKRFKKMMFLDIQRCFDSIYSHTISWVLYGKGYVKDNLQVTQSTFGGAFDILMQKMNNNETNGIVIGPEVSRLFSEVLFQGVDKKIHSLIAECNIDGYRIFRYVDDYFIFYNSDKDGESIGQSISKALKEVNLHINESKIIKYPSPIFSNKSNALSKMSELIAEDMKLYVVLRSGKEEDENIEDPENSSEKEYTYRIKSLHYVNLNERIKAILIDSNVVYEDVSSYLFGALERRLNKFILLFRKNVDKFENDEELHELLDQVIEFVFFWYLANVKVTTTIKLSYIVCMVLELLKLPVVPSSTRDYIRRKIYKELFLSLNIVSEKRYHDIDKSYILILMAELQFVSKLTSDEVCRVFEISTSNDEVDWNLTYWEIVTLLYYIKNHEEYNSVRECLIQYICRYLAKKNAELSNSCEYCLLMLDLLSCPFLSEKTRKAFWRVYDPKCTNQQFKDIAGLQKYWFITWSDINLGKELEAKRGKAVY